MRTAGDRDCRRRLDRRTTALNRPGDRPLQDRFRQGPIHAPTLIDAELASATRGLLLTTKPATRISADRAELMLQHYADLPLTRHPMVPFQRRALALRNNMTTYDAFYVALAEVLDAPLLIDDRTFDGAPGHTVIIETWT